MHYGKRPGFTAAFFITLFNSLEHVRSYIPPQPLWYAGKKIDLPQTNGFHLLTCLVKC
jgi:hypothetical protein